MSTVTSLRRFHREIAALLIVGSSVLHAAGTADAAVTTPSDTDAVAGIGFQSVP